MRPRVIQVPRPPALPGLPGPGAPQSRPLGPPRSPGTTAPRPRAPAVEGPRSYAVPAQVRSQARGGRVRAPGSRAARSPFQSDGRAGPGAARPFELAEVGAAESLRCRARDPAPSGRRARAAEGGTGRSAGPSSAGSPGRKGHCPEPLRPRAGLGGGRRRSSWGERGSRPVGAQSRAGPPGSAAAGRLSRAPPRATWTFRVRPSQKAAERGEGRRCGRGLFGIKSPSATACQQGGCGRIPEHLSSRLPHP